MDFEISLTHTKVQSLTDEKNKIDTLEESLLYVQSQSTRNNLIFTNIHEAVGGAHEQTEHKVREFLVEKCKLVQQGVNDIQFERVYRLGSIATMVTVIVWLNSPFSRT